MVSDRGNKAILSGWLSGSDLDVGDSLSGNCPYCTHTSIPYKPAQDKNMIKYNKQVLHSNSFFHE